MPRSLLQSLASSLILSRLDYGNTTLVGISSYLLDRLQSVMNSTARLVFTSSRYDHITPLLHRLHWLRAAERTDYKLTVLVKKHLHRTAPPYLADEFYQSADYEARRRLVVISDRPLHTAVNYRRPHFSSRRCSYLEQSAMERERLCLLYLFSVSLQALFSLTDRPGG